MVCLSRHRGGERRCSSNPRKRWVASTMLRPLYPQKVPGKHCTACWVCLGDGLDCAEDFEATSIRPPDCPARSFSLYRLSYPGRAEFCAFYNIRRQWPLNVRRLMILLPRFWGGGFLTAHWGYGLISAYFLCHLCPVWTEVFRCGVHQFQEHYQLVDTRYKNTENGRSCPHWLVLVLLHAI
jgi:hypothetical protein